MPDPLHSDSVTISIPGKVPPHPGAGPLKGEFKALEYKRYAGNEIARAVAAHYGVNPVIIGGRAISPFCWPLVLWTPTEFRSETNHDQLNVLKTVEDALTRWYAGVIWDDTEKHCVLEAVPGPRDVSRGEEAMLLTLRFPQSPRSDLHERVLAKAQSKRSRRPSRARRHRKYPPHLERAIEEAQR